MRDQTQAKLDELDAAISAAEYHGHLIGRFVGGHAVEGAVVMSIVSDLTGAARDAVEEQADQWRTLIASYFKDFQSEYYGFQPMLPSDEKPLCERLDGIGLWCTGFLNGIGCALNEEQAKGVLESNETIADLIEVSNLDSSAEDSEENEALFTEIVEFVRLSVLNLHENLSEQLATEPDESESVH